MDVRHSGRPAPPRLERYLCTELDDVVGARQPACDDLAKLPLLGRTLAETLRLYPSVAVLSRTPLGDVSLGGPRIPAGADVLFSQAAW
ncbi:MULTISPECIES: cytochrome P450 [unclassified Streptomyces]|uniref:cytochrome P450 n=1 Tax=unclassified Streptomyces TaxID=2593676 RepID=UPI00382575E9